MLKEHASVHLKLFLQVAQLQHIKLSEHGLDTARKLALEKGIDMAEWLYLPVIARQDWVVMLNRQGNIQGFLRGDGF